jgi:hypothetical protein
MTDVQILTIVLTVLLPFTALLYSNSRITDVRSNITEAKETLRADMGTLGVRTDAGFERLGNKMDHPAGEVATLKEMFATHLREHHGKPEPRAF